MKTFITWDLGGTKCAVGQITLDITTGHFHCVKQCSIKLTDCHSLEHLVDQIEQQLNYHCADADAICIGGAGQYDGQCLNLESSYPFVMNFAEVAQKHRWPPFAVIHDYAPIVCATFSSYMYDPANIQWLHAGHINPYGRRVAIGVGTGLGLKDGVLLPNGDFWLGQNEAGHIGIGLAPVIDTACRQRHLELMQYLSQDPVPVTFQKVLSGQGTVRLHQFFYPQAKDITPEQVGHRMRRGEAPETVKAFAWYLGLFVGTMQLTFMPEGGIWLAGGVALQHLEAFDCPDFQAGIEASPAYHQQRNQYPLGILRNHHHALIGGAYYASKRLVTN